MKIYIVESEIISQRMYMHFPNALGVISGGRELFRHCVMIVPGQTVLISYTSVAALLTACMQSCPGGNAAGACAVGAVKNNSL